MPLSSGTIKSQEHNGTSMAGGRLSVRNPRDLLTQASNTRRSLSLMAAALAVIVVSLACQLNPGGSEEPLTPTTEPAAESIEVSVTTIVEQIDPSKPDSLYAPEELVTLGRPAVPALLDLLNSPDITSRWAAVYALSRLAQAEDIPALARGLEDPNLSNRAGVAATLLWLGDERGIPILLEALNSDELIAFSHPPELVADYARYVLEELNPGTLPQGNLDIRRAGSLAAPYKYPLMDVSVEASGCKIDIELNLQFTGTGATEGLASKWARGIRDMWDEAKSSFCCEVALTVNTKVGGAADPNFTQITVVQVPPGGYHRSYMYMGTVSNGTSNDVEGSWASNDSGPVAAHEAGHAMGVDDEYRDRPDGSSEPTGEAANDSRGDGKPSTMAQTWPDAEGDAPEAKARHIDSILKYFGERCLCCAVIEWDAGSTVSIFFEGRVFTCDGVTWQGEYTQALQFGPTSAETSVRFELMLAEGASNSEVQFVSEGAWTIEDEVIPFQDNIVFRMTLAEDGTNATIDMESEGGILYAGGQTVPVPGAQPATTGELVLPLKPYEACPK